MPNMGVSLTENQRARLEVLAEIKSRSMSNMIGWLIDQAWVAAYQERELQTAGAQNPELKPEPTA